MSKTKAQQTTLNLRDYLDHGAAPFWYVAAEGAGRPTSHPVTCPVCGTEEVTIRRGGPTERLGLHYILFTPERGEVGVRTTDGEATAGAADSTGLSIGIPMNCANGHAWMIDIGDGPGTPHARFGVVLCDDDYEAAFPEVRERSPW